MPRRPNRSTRPKPRPNANSSAVAAPRSTATEHEGGPGLASEPFWNGRRVGLAVLLLLTLHLTLAVRSLVRENPTVDEVIHLPAGLSYWRQGSFRLYHHNPPLIKLVAAVPVLAMKGVDLPPLDEHPNKAAYAHEFAQRNAGHYLEVCARARLVMPCFALLGGLVVFAWSRRLYGAGGGLLSLALWTFCPNVLAHGRLVTTDVGATVLGLVATFSFWRYLETPTRRRAGIAGLLLGLAQLSKFSMILLYGVWPALGLLRLLWIPGPGRIASRLLRAAGHAGLILVLSLIVIDAGYRFEGVGIPLGKYEFVSRTLTRPVPPGTWRPSSPDRLLAGAYRYRINRFRGTWLGVIPAPLPKHYLLGFDDQKLEAEGIPLKFLDASSTSDEIKGYPVYLDGVLRQESWWYYYLLTLAYKVPEGTWALALASFWVLATARRPRGSWFDEVAVLTIPALILLVMSVFTNINLGLRYVLPIFPFMFISIGKVVPWAAGLGVRSQRRLATGFVAASLAATVAATIAISPHYLAYFNVVSGGPSRGASHLIDSNLDWGQDLVGLRRWLAKHAPDEPIGLAYFGQINPNLFRFRDEGGFSWFLPPPMPGAMPPDQLPSRYRGRLEGLKFRPGLYAVSASLVRGLPWFVYDDDLPRWAPHQAWIDAFRYFEDLTPVADVGHSILIYRVTPEQADRLSRNWGPDLAPSPGPAS